MRDYNEDRISIVLDLKKNIDPKSNQSNTMNSSKKISFFAVFDGHGGATCAEFLRDNLHNFVAQ
jgi:protein phosphatase 2C family protein 2/3